MRGVELLAHRIGAEDRGEWGARLENFDGGQRSRIGQHDARAIVEVEDEAREAWKRILRG